MNDLRQDILAEVIKAYAQRQSVLLRGPLASGRAQYFYAADHQVGRKGGDRLSITASADLTIENFYGEMIPRRKGPIWYDGVLATAMRSGHRLLIYDIDRLPEPARAILVDAMAGRGVRGGEEQPELTARPGFAIDATAVGAPDPELVKAFAIRLSL